MYVLGALLSILIGTIKISGANGTTSIKGVVYNDFLIPLCGENATLASLIFALLFVMLNWIIGYVLYKKKIYIKI